jgi:hypothetical protein
MMDCKRALEETGGDLDAAVKLLREKGLASAGKRAERETSDGLVGYIVSNGAGSMVGVGSETDFVAKNDEFQAFAEKVLRAVQADGSARRWTGAELAGSSVGHQTPMPCGLKSSRPVVEVMRPPAARSASSRRSRQSTPSSRQAMHRVRPMDDARDVPPDVVRRRRVYANSDEASARGRA